mmetsp:Transcript_13996/g.38461  ORF Transcript_13996/g.38461 Transcript_13996/m.38461 type:complete len:100 (+) Transcript_13996:64-363(+)
MLCCHSILFYCTTNLCFASWFPLYADALDAAANNACTHSVYVGLVSLTKATTSSTYIWPFFWNGRCKYTCHGSGYTRYNHPYTPLSETGFKKKTASKDR